MKKTVLLAITLVLTVTIHSQINTQKFDFKFGSGVGFMGDGDMRTLSFENELNYKINQYFSTGISLNYGKSDYGVNLHSDYLMGGANVFISPFKNNKNNNFKIGTGLSFFTNTNIYESSRDPENGYMYAYYKDKTAGFNLIIEDEQIIYERFLIGAKLYLNGNIAGANFIGTLVKVGIIL